MAKSRTLIQSLKLKLILFLKKKKKKKKKKKRWIIIYIDIIYNLIEKDEEVLIKIY